MITVISALLKLMGDALDGRKTDEEVALGLIDAAFASGVPSAMLAKYLTAKARDNAELAADLAQFLKTGEAP